MGYEIDFLPVGKESKSGDAIALRYGDLAGGTWQRVVIVDGGYTDDGFAVVEHVNKYYGTDRVDLVVSTHPDGDHVGGLKVVLDELRVDQLWMHLPWNHSGALAEGRRSLVKFSGLSEVLQKSLDGASDLESLARAKGVPIAEPFAGRHLDNGTFTVLGPTLEFYERVLAQIKAETVVDRLMRLPWTLVEAVKSFVEETLQIETLTDDGETSPQNNTSAICLLSHDNHRLLLTGDAGVPALEGAVSALEAIGVTAGGLRFVQVPHHGSRRNVGPTILNRLLGAPGQQSTHSTAFVSAAAKGEPKHPSKKVSNAFIRRGYSVHATQGMAKCYPNNAPDRGWVASTPVPFHERVEHDED